MLEIKPTRWFWLILADLTVFNHSSGLDRQVFSSKGLQFFMRGIGWIVQYKTYPSAATSGLTWGLHHSNKLAMRGFSENHTFFRIPKQDSKNIHTPPNFEKRFSQIHLIPARIKNFSHIAFFIYFLYIHISLFWILIFHSRLKNYR